jgi:hypothetical protein
MSISHLEGSLPLVTLAYFAMEICIPYILFGKRLTAGLPINSLANKWQWVTVFFQGLIQASVIHAKVHGAILLWNEEDGSTC